MDIHHPWRSAEVALRILPALNYTLEEISDVCTLILRHQNLGNLAKPDAEPATPQRLAHVAARLRNPAMVTMLAALTEGDVRSVRNDVPGRTWFTPEMADRVKDVAGKVGSVVGKQGALPAPAPASLFVRQPKQ